jgi:hypothetical protein
LGFSKPSLQGGGNVLQREVASNYTTFFRVGLYVMVLGVNLVLQVVVLYRF